MREMKDSGVEWIGKIPVEWKCSKIKHHFKIGSGTTPKSDIPSYWDGDIVWITPADFKTDDVYVSEGHRNLTQEGFESSTLEIIPAGNIIFSKRAPIGQVVINSVDLCTNQGCLTAVPLDKSNVKYYRYAMSVATNQFELAGSGTTFKEISATAFGNFILPSPSVSEQKKITEYLDRKCFSIDSVIMKQQVIIEKLKEYKISIVIEYVTKGINTCHEYKDSNVEWIGTIPSEWKLLRLKYASEIMRGRFNHRPRNDPQYYDGEYPFVQTGDVARANKFITHYSQSLNKMGFDVSKEFPKGSICMTIAANIGDVAILGFDACFPDSIVGFVAKKDIYWEYLFYVLVAMKQQLNKNAIISTQLNLNIEIIKEEYIPCPPAEEQQAIVDYLNRRTALIEMDISKRKSFIDRLIDYKQAIILETVTGKKKI